MNGQEIKHLSHSFRKIATAKETIIEIRFGKGSLCIILLEQKNHEYLRWKISCQKAQVCACLQPGKLLKLVQHIKLTLQYDRKQLLQKVKQVASQKRSLILLEGYGVRMENFILHRKS